MASIRIGGDPESYMEAPQMTVTDKEGGASLIASILGLLGVNNKPAGKMDQPAAPDPITTPDIAENAPKAQGLSLPALDQATEALSPPASKSSWGELYLKSMKPLQKIDPNSAL